MNSITVVLHSLLNADDAVRKPAEKQISDAKKDHPQELMAALLEVLSSSQEFIMRQQAAIYMSHLVNIEHSDDCHWESFSADLQARCKEVVLRTVEAEENAMVLKGLVHVVAKIADLCVDPDTEGQITNWPQLLPTLWYWLGIRGRPRRSAMEIMRHLTPTIGNALVCESGMSTLGAILTTSFTDDDPETRVECCLLTLALIEEKDIATDRRAALNPYVKTIVEILKAELAHGHLERAKSILEALITAIDCEPDLFKNFVQSLLLPELIENIASRADIDQDCREMAMEVVMTFIERKPKFCAKQSHRTIICFVVAVNMEWLLVDESIQPTSDWVQEEDGCHASAGWREQEDNYISDVAEQNLDRLAKALSSDLIVPIFGTFVEGFLKSPTVWNREQAAMMAIYIIAEYVEDLSLVEKMVLAALHRLRHEHARVRHAALRCIMELSDEHEPYLQEAMAEDILAAIYDSMNDSEPRVATMAMTAFQVFAEPLVAQGQEDLIEALAPKLLETFWHRVEHGVTRSMREEALTGVAVVAEVIKTAFAPYYDKLMPLLKRFVDSSGQSTLQGKALECVSMLGHAVGKDKFLPDATEAMRGIVVLCRTYSNNDQGVFKEYVHRSAERICKVLHEDFADFLPHMLPPMLDTLTIKPEEMSPSNFDLEDEEYMTFTLLGDCVLGVKTCVLEELLDVLKLICVFVTECKSRYAPYLRVTCEHLVPLLKNPVTGQDEHVRDSMFELWGAVVECAKLAGDVTTVKDLVMTFINGVLPSLEGTCMELAYADSVNVMQSQAQGLAAMIRAAGSIDDDVMERVTEGVKKAFELTEKKKQTMSHSSTTAASDLEDTDSDTSDVEDDEALANIDRLRMCLADVFGALMETSGKAFQGPMIVKFADFARKLMDSKCPEDKVLAMHVSNDMLEYLGDCVLAFGELFWTQVLDSICDAEPAFRIASGSVIVQGARSGGSSFQKIAPLAVDKLRVAMAAAPTGCRKKDVAERALHVQAIDNATAALGWVLEHHAHTLMLESGAVSELWQLWVCHMPLVDREEACRSHALLLRLAQRDDQFVQHALRILCELYKTDYIDESTSNGLLTMVDALGDRVESMVSSDWSSKQKKKLKGVVKEVRSLRANV